MVPGHMVIDDMIVCSLDQHPEISAPKFVLGTDLLATHHRAEFADLVDVLAVDFDIVDRLRDSRKGDAQN